MKKIEVVLEKATESYDKIYSYSLPEHTICEKGCRVLVPFGASNKTRIGLAISEAENVDDNKLKSIIKVLDEKPLLDEEGLYLLRALKSTTFCTWGDAIKTIIPPGAGMKIDQKLIFKCGDITTNISDEAKSILEYVKSKKKGISKEKVIKELKLVDEKAIKELAKLGLLAVEDLIKKNIADDKVTMARIINYNPNIKLTAKQSEIFDFLQEVECASLKEINYFTGCGSEVVKRMAKNDILELFEETIKVQFEPDDKEVDNDPIILTKKQNDIYEGIKNEKSGEMLLYGITGSGKTSIYLKLIEDNINEGKTVLVLIPEISLTPQTVNIFSKRFGSKIAVLNSSLTMTQRLEEWQKIKDKKAQIVLGTRSAVFAPLNNIGLIVIDEEQEHTYHSEKSPRYHAINIARLRMNFNNAALLLCSATPSIENMYRARKGQIKYFELLERFSEHGLPEVETIDLRTAYFIQESSLISEELGEQIGNVLERKEQAILLLNRRGYSTLIKCSRCGEVSKCPNCSIPLTFHSANNKFVCHYCGYSESSDSLCKKCSSKMLRYTGAGTQKAEEDLNKLFPKAKILRMDADTTMSRLSYQTKFEAFSKGEYDIIIGTQMIAKGLDFPNVTLVGVICADQSLFSEDFRAYEKTFSLVTQVVGRCGRADKPGLAVIQTYTPEHRVLEFAAQQNYKDFYEEEIGYREAGLYPPFCDILCLLFSSDVERLARDNSITFTSSLSEAMQKQKNVPVRIIGPAQANPYKVSGKYRYRILVKCRNNNAFRIVLNDAINIYKKKHGMIYPSIDFYYDSHA